MKPKEYLMSQSLQFDPRDTAVVCTDPQNDVLTESGGAWPLVAASVRENRTVENIERLFKAAKVGGFHVFISPHYYYPTDESWHYRDPTSTMMHANKLFKRLGIVNDDALEGSGADWVECLKPYINDGKTIVVAQHKLYGPETNDLVLQLRKRGIQRIIMAGMLANMCVEAHTRELLEQGFEVVIVRDATAGPRDPKWGDGYQAAMINFRFLAHSVLTTDEIVASLG
jgi:nicotinamidase-related amidase